MAYTIEGTWEEVLLHGKQLTGKRMRVTVMQSSLPNEASEPNEAMLSALEEIGHRQEDQRESSGDDDQDLIREARSGAMYDTYPTQPG